LAQAFCKPKAEPKAKPRLKLARLTTPKTSEALISEERVSLNYRSLVKSKTQETNPKTLEGCSQKARPSMSLRKASLHARKG